MNTIDIQPLQQKQEGNTTRAKRNNAYTKEKRRRNVIKV
jgi:hypothetical protein